MVILHGEKKIKLIITLKIFIKMHRLIILVIITLQNTSLIAQTNGYSLEFADVVTKSIDSIGSISPGTYTKTYTVPPNHVLKIINGLITTVTSSGSTPRRGFLKIGDNIITPGTLAPSPGFITDYTGAAGSTANFVIKIFPENPVWAPAGSVVSINVLISSSVTNVIGNWFSGILYRMVPN